MAAKAQQLTAWGYPTRWLDKETLLAREPTLTRDAVSSTPVLWCELEGWLDTRLYIDTLLDAVIDGGGSVATATSIASIIRQGNCVTLASGRALYADRVVNCCGCWVDSSLFQPDLAPPLAPTAGLLVRVPSAAAPVRHVLITPTFDIRPDGPDHSLICPNDLEVSWTLTESPAARDQAAAALLAQAARLLPGLQGLTDYQVITGIRALLATLTAREMITSQPAALLASFRPDRFFLLTARAAPWRPDKMRTNAHEPCYLTGAAPLTAGRQNKLTALVRRRRVQGGLTPARAAV